MLKQFIWSFPLVIFLRPLLLVSASIHQHWLNESSDLRLYLEPRTAYLFCFTKPCVYKWAINCLKDFEISLHLNASNDPAKTSVITVDVYDGLSEKVFLAHRSCSALDSSLSAPTSVYFSFLYSPPLLFRKRSLDSSGLIWAVPSYPSSCFVVCSSSQTPFIASRLLIDIRPFFNERHVFTTVIGFILLFIAEYLSKKLSFYYFGGSMCVVLGSLLILFFVGFRLLPVKRGGAVLQAAFVLLGGTFSLVCVLLDYVRSSVVHFLSNNAELTFMYVLVVALLSLLLFYWFDLPERFIGRYPRTRTIVKYLLRFIGATLVVRSIHLPFTEDELIGSFFDFASTFSFIETLPSSLIQLAKFMSPKLMWLLLILAVMLFVDSIYVMYAMALNKRTRESIIKVSDVHRVSSGFDGCIPGSPWASSSPYQFQNHEVYFRTPKLTPRRMSLQRASFDVYNPDLIDSIFVSPRSHMLTTKATVQDDECDEVFTEDESD